MKRRSWKRRVLTVLLALTMVVTSVDATVFVSRAVTNAYEATSGTHGATYDEATGKVTFYVNESDAFYSQVDHMWYKEYTSYEEAAQAHVSAGGNFIAGVGATAVTANADGTKTAVVDVADGTGAILYYFNAGAGHARPDYEHIIVIGNDAAGGSEEGSGETGGEGTGETGNTDEESGDSEVTTIPTVEGNLLVNGNFANKGESWGNFGDLSTVTWNEGSVVFDITAGVADWAQSIYQDVTLEAGATYKVSFDIESSIERTVMADIKDSGVREFTSDVIPANTKTTLSYETSNANAGVNRFFIYLGNPALGAHTVTISNVSIVKCADAPTGEEGGTVEGGDVEDSGSTIVTGEYINLEEKSKVDQGIFSWVGTDASDATISYAGESVIVSANTWGQQDWWSVQWSVQDLDVTAGNWQVEYDIVSTIDKPVLSKLTSFGTADIDTPIIEAKYDLTANESKHYSEVATIGADGKVRLFFNLAGGTGTGTVTISNVKLTAVEGGSTETGGNEGTGEVGGNTEAVANAIVFDNVETSFYRSQDDGGWAGDSNATISYDGTKAVVTADHFGWNAWGIQWKLLGLTSEAENNVYAFDVVSSINKSINVKNETSGVMETITLTAGQTYHYETAVTGTTVDITFDLTGSDGAGTLTFTNMTFAEGTISEEGGNEGGETEAVANAIVFDNVSTEFYRSQDDGGWAGDSNATISYDGTKAVVSADHFGWNPWGIQWKLLDLVSEEETNTFAFDVVSSINKSINVKDENSGNMETITLTAGETYHYETTITGTTANITFDLTGSEGAGTLTFTNMVFGTGNAVKDNGLVFDDLETSFYRSQDDGGWAGDSNATITYDGTKAVVSADHFGWNAWGIQWKLLGLTSEAEENVYAFDVVSTINKSINVKNETSGVMETITLTAGETYHYETAVTGTTVDITFDLTGSEGAGTLTFTNMTFGPAEGNTDEGGEGEEGDAEGTLAANSEPLNFEELNIETYLSQNDGGWAGDSNVVFTYSGTTALITADNFGWNPWGIQWKLLDLTSSVEDNVFEFDVVSSIDKTIVYKNENTAETETLTLKAGETYHFASAVTGKTLNVTFDLTGGAAAGSLTFTNMKFGPVGVVEVAPALTLDRAVDKANGYKVGENVVLNFAADATAWAEKVSAVKVNNQATSADKYTVGEGTVTLDSSVFKKEGVYTVEVEAEGFNATAVKFPVYDADVTSESWNVAWEDQFNGTELDTTKWSYEIGIQSGEDGASASPVYWGNNEKQYYTKENIEVKDGYLVITGDKLTQEVKDQYNVTDTTVQYTSGRIRTVTDSGEVMAATTYGRIEAKMILPAGDGYWPAFWMLPTQETINLYGTWASSGELDIMEAVGQNPGQVNGTIHYGGNWPNNVYTGGTYVFPEGGSIADEHVYAVEWEPGELRWYVDDVLYHVENNWYGIDANGEKYSYPAPFDEDFYILFNLAMSGNYVSNVMPTEMGKQMKVDYVRILVDENTDYNAAVTAPTTDRDVAFFEANGGYVDLIQDKDYTTLASHAFGDGANVIPGTGYWSSAVNTGAGANATVEVVDGAAKIDVTKQGANDYNIQLIQNIPLAKGYTYRITFDAWTDVTSGRQIIVAPKGDADNAWKAYDSGITAALTTTKKTYTHEFTMTTDSDPTARLEMNLGGALGSVYVDNVSVIALTDAEIESGKEASAKEPLASGEHVYNGAFDKGAGKLGDWTVEGTAGSTADRNYTVTVGAEGAKLTQTGLQLLSEDTYKLTFDAKTADAGKVSVVVKDETGAVTYASEEFELTTDLANYGVEFTVPVDQGTDMGTVEFEFIGEGETITIDNVSMMRLTNVHMEWDAYEFYPIGENSLEGFTTYDEVWTWAVNPVSPTDIGDGEMALVVKTTPASETWKVMLQKENAALSKGMTYRIQYAIKASAEDQKVEVKIEDTSYSPCYNETLTVGTDWTYVDTTFVSTLAGAGALKFCLAGVDQECDIYVKDVNIVLEGIPAPQFAEDAEITEIELNATETLNIVHSPKVQEKYQSFTYVSSDTDVIEVAEDGTMTGKALGTATITVTSVLGTEFSFDVTVVEEIEDDTDDEGNTGDEGDTDEGDTDEDNKPGENNKPGQDNKPGHDNKPGQDNKPGHDNKPGEDEKPGHDNKPGKDEKPGHDNKPGQNNKPNQDNKPNSGNNNNNSGNNGNNGNHGNHGNNNNNGNNGGNHGNNNHNNPSNNTNNRNQVAAQTPVTVIEEEEVAAAATPVEEQVEAEEAVAEEPVAEAEDAEQVVAESEEANVEETEEEAVSEEIEDEAAPLAPEVEKESNTWWIFVVGALAIAAVVVAFVARKKNEEA